MVMLRKMRALVLLFALVVLFIGAFSIMSADTAQAKRCCWVMVCTVNPPVVCWEVCKTCPTFP